MRIVFSVMLSMVKFFIGGTLAFEGSMLKMSDSFQLRPVDTFLILDVLRSVVVSFVDAILLFRPDSR